MATQQTKNKISNQQPLDKAVGLLASCSMVVLGAWMGLRPETILLRALVVGCVTAMLARIMINTWSSIYTSDDE